MIRRTHLLACACAQLEGARWRHAPLRLALRVPMALGCQVSTSTSTMAVARVSIVEALRNGECVFALGMLIHLRFNKRKCSTRARAEFKSASKQDSQF